MSKTRVEALAATLEQGARELIEFAETLTEVEWQIHTPKDGRKVGVIVHHVGNMYPIEIELAQKLAAGGEITGLTFDDVHAINAKHAAEKNGVAKAEAIAFVRTNAASAAKALRAFTDEELDLVAPNSMYGGAPLTCQFMLEDHAVRHSFHHLAKIRAVVELSRKVRQAA